MMWNVDGPERVRDRDGGRSEDLWPLADMNAGLGPGFKSRKVRSGRLRWFGSGCVRVRSLDSRTRQSSARHRCRRGATVLPPARRADAVWINIRICN